MMNLQTLSHRVLVSLVGTALGALGCSHAGSNSLNGATASAPPRRTSAVAYQNDSYGRPMVTAAQLPAVARPANVAPLEMQTVQETAMRPAESRVDQGIPAFTSSATADAHVVSQIGLDSGIPQAQDPEGAVQAINRNAINPDDSFHDRQNPAPRRAFVDLTAQPWFSHASDYSSLAGQLRFRKSETCWRLRYASLDESDPYEGEVTLIDYPHTTYLKDGEYVRVNGHLVDPTKKELGSNYRVSSMFPIDKSGDTLAGEKTGETNTSLSK
jgi:hypothetical protein